MDHCERQKRKASAWDRANIVSLLTFFYTGGTFRKAWKKDLQEDNLHAAVKSCRSTKNGDKLEGTWEDARTTITAPTAFKLIWRKYGKQYLCFGLVDLCWQIFKAAVEADSMSNLISYFSPHSRMSRRDAFYNAGVVLGLTAFSMVYLHNYILWLHKFALKVRIAFSALIYRKALKLSPAALKEVSLGNIVTLITKDVASFQTSVWTINDIWVGSLRTIFVSYLIYAKMGPIAFLGIGMLFIVIPLQIYLAKVIVRMRLVVGEKTDERLQTLQETLSAIKIIKMYAWEVFFDRKITEARRKELDKMLKAYYLRIVLILIGILSSRVAFYVLIMVYIWLGNTTNADLVFYILSCFKNLRTVLAIDIPYGLARGGEMCASLIRINHVLNAEELEPVVHQHADKPLINLVDVTVGIQKNNFLHEINLHITKGLTIITGTVGSSKSTLLKTILGDYAINSGTIEVKGSISYASQDPWLFPSSIKQNILFGELYNDARYQEVIRVCALTYDFNLLDHGDETIVTDKGMNLSKGQQARINLARAVYRNSNIYLLDDSLTALDNTVQDYIFRECIQGFLKEKIVLLVTQCKNHYNSGDNLLILDNGRFVSSTESDVADLEKIPVTALQSTPINLDDADTADDCNIAGDCKITDDCNTEESKLLHEEVTKKSVYQEVKREGSVDIKIYIRYLKYGGGFLILCGIFLLYVAAQFAEISSSKLLTSWVDSNQRTIDLSNETDSPLYQKSLEETNFNINMYSGAIVLSIVLDLIKFYVLLNFCRVASLNIHKAMIKSVIRATMAFFDNHFIGNILNRFSQDLNNVDEMLAVILADVIRIFFDIGGAIVIIAYVDWQFLVPCLIFLGISYLIRVLYMPAGRSLKRLEAATRSPLVGHINSSLEGLTTIRACKSEAILKKEFDKHQDLFTSAHFMLLCTSRAFGVAVDFFCTLLIFVIVARFLFFDTGTSAGDVGLVLTQLFILSDNVQWGIRQWAEMENYMTSVERLLEYTEIQEESTTGQVIEYFPKQGRVTFQDVTLTHINNEQVLKKINFTVNPREKIGIVGRTGAGKSSIISVLCRLYQIQGSILIDGINIDKLSLEFLRNCIAIIPQDPILFTGTMRTNIDPLNLYADQEIWEALGKVKLKALVPSLDLPINEKGSNFSSGQRQLICLARAIIRKNRIVVLDEATANMDPKTDALLHDTIKENFQDCTVFIIAHRLHSIIDADKILVLNRGEIVESGTPEKLLQNRNGYFAKMMAKSKF